jgi:tRNA(fMet)-specific endonuclease VapC
VYCFDTDILAAALLREPPMHLVRRLARAPAEEQCTTAVSVGEIAYAVARNGDEEIAGRVRELIAAASAVLPFDQEAAETYGSLRAHLDRIGVRLDEPSLRVASIAISRDLTLVTASARLYDRIPGLRIENWLEPDDLEASLATEATDPALEVTAADDEAARNGDAALEAGAGRSFRHSGVVSQLEERARTAGERAAGDGAEGPRAGGR